ncbi:MBL fold metallo-hydrolase [Dryocola sp. BD613]|uniref:MBL fold metallo-hydrolase n=1 Tax=Dryocola sp. BD613 TaxID=3133272 RepID=UPI003F4FF941
MLAGSIAGFSRLFSTIEFGKLPDGERLARIQASPNWRDGKFHNETTTPMYTNGKGFLSVLWEYLFVKHSETKPERALPVVKTDLRALQSDEDVVIWLGHSSWFMQIDGHKILIDPVFSSYAAPFSFMNKAFNGPYPWQAADMPEIDFLIISHDHWDHLDYPTLKALKPKVKQIVTALGVGSHLEAWGFAPQIIHELDWHEKVVAADSLTIHVLPARHFSGRGLTANKTLWASFMFATPRHQVFYSGDSGYGPHFKNIGEQFGPVDLAILENGQYDPAWQHIHMLPEETAAAAADLNAKVMLPGHAGRFSMANHSWYEPWKRIAAASKTRLYKLLTPEMGEVVKLNDPQQQFLSWWEAKAE